MNQIIKANIIKNKRTKAANNDTPELKKKRQKFLDWLLVENYNLKVLEMYPGEEDVIKSKLQTPQYIHEYQYCNTRTIIESETDAEIDKLNWDEALKIIWDICERLIQFKFHFVLFCSEGSRSPHIRIYDFDQLKTLKSYQREKAQEFFWKRIADTNYKHLDKSIWSDDHLIQLEFAPHWKTGNPFILIYEHLPQKKLKREGEKQCKICI